MLASDVSWLAVLCAGLVGGIVAVLLEFALTSARQNATLYIRGRNVMMALHAEIAENVGRVGRSAIWPVAIMPFEEPVAEYLANGLIFELVPDYTVMQAFNESVRSRRYSEIMWGLLPQGEKFPQLPDDQKEHVLRSVLLVRLPTWAALAQWVEKEYRIPSTHRVGFAKLQDLVRRSEKSATEYFAATGRLEFARQWNLLKACVGLE